jgi:hypothetical protein
MEREQVYFTALHCKHNGLGVVRAGVIKVRKVIKEPEGKHDSRRKTKN